LNGIVSCAIGTLGRDAELRYTQQGQAVLNFSIAVADAKRQEGADTEWLRVAVWGERAEELNTAGLAKGAECYVEGRLKLNTWNGPDGQQRSGLELSAWRVDVLGAIGRRAKRPEPLFNRSGGDAA
jgi:single-strand DNA-binding protein